MELHRLDCLCSNGSTESYDFVRRFLAETPAEEVRPARLLTGEDLIEMGMKPGPEFSTILQAVEDGQLEGKIPDREAAVEFVRRNYV
jgi:poly(A) polymerase